MSYDTKERNRTIITIVKLLTVFFSMIFFATFIIDINNNIGILPLIFFSLMIYSIVSIVYPFIIAANNPIIIKTVIKINPIYVIFSIINLILGILAIIVIW